MSFGQVVNRIYGSLAGSGLVTRRKQCSCHLFEMVNIIQLPARFKSSNSVRDMIAQD